MRKRMILLFGGVALLVLAAAAPALLALVQASAPDPYTTPVPYAWTLQLRGAKKSLNLNKSQFRAYEALKNHEATIVVDENKPSTPELTDDTTYKGVPLWRIVALIDDRDPSTFNWKLANGKGYGVEVMGVDYFSYVYSSQQIATLKKALILSGNANGAPLVWGSVKVSDTTGTFKPSWPLKLVSSDSSVTGKMKPGGILRISIVPAPAPTTTPAPSAEAPF